MANLPLRTERLLSKTLKIKGENMKGIEGLALKYIVIILVAALVIGVAFSVVTTFTGMAAGGAAGLNSTLTAGLEKQTNMTCVQFGCVWNSGTQTCTC